MSHQHASGSLTGSARTRGAPMAPHRSRLVWSAAGALMALLAFGCAGSTPPPTAAQAAQLCVGVPEAEARAGLAGMQPAIERVEPLNTKIQMGRGVFTREVGATVFLRATPGVTQQWIGRVLACHQARLAVGSSTPTAEADPLALADVNTSVASTETGFAVEI